MKRLLVLLVLALSACGPGRAPLTPSPGPFLPTYFPTVAGFGNQAAPQGTPAATPRPGASSLPPTPTVYEPYTIDSLRQWTFGSGNIEVVQAMEENDAFTRYLIRYTSDKTTIYGFANVPQGAGPFPVIVAVHGFVRPADYQTLDYSTPAADTLAQAGYIVLHPNLRGYPPSENGNNLFRAGMTVDVLNLLALTKAKAGPAELFANAATDRIGLWGHSLGGEIVLRALILSPDIKAAVLYASMSGDDLKNSQLLFRIFPDPVYQMELGVPPAVAQRISPKYYYGSIRTPIQMHHGTADQTVPLAWAEETCDDLTRAGVQVECLYYPGEDHTFRRRVADQFWGAMLGFYERYLAP